VLNRALAGELGLGVEWLEQHAAGLLSGTEVSSSTRPIAQAYAGHQFGHFNPQLGDGRAILLGEVVDPSGRRFDLQLKGSGKTPFSRGGDGRAAIDSALREYIVSEAMHALGIPTTRSLAVVTTGETVVRDRPKPGAVLTRIAASHVRIGTLEFLAARSKQDILRKLVDYTLHRHYPDLVDAPNQAKALLDAVAVAQAQLVAQWMLVGFVHGVMNTDNVTLSGETIDYGPCAFMDAYDPKTVFSGIDHNGRYAYGNQPAIGAWNLARMAEALLDLLADDPEEAAAVGHAALDVYAKAFGAAFSEGMDAKLGLDSKTDAGELVSSLLTWMHEHKADYTQTFRKLSASLRDGTPAFDDEGFVAWNERWRENLGNHDPGEVADRMDRVNPLYIPRNHKVEAALDAALEGDLEPTHALVEVLSQPFTAQPDREAYETPAPADFGPYQTHCNT